MTHTIGIIPAGGKAERFKGLAKELLPVSNEDCALSRCVKSMQMGLADEIYIASRQDRVAEHYRVTEKIGNIVLSAVGYRGLWEFVATVGEKAKADWYYFAMPDTVYPVNVFMREKTKDVACGMFRTSQPHRFGVVSEGKIIDKPEGMTDMAIAWGLWIWSAAAMEVLTQACRETQDHTAALNVLIGKFGTEIDAFLMPYYYDFATFEDYTEFLCSQP